MSNSSNINTKILDHIVHLTPPDSVAKTSEQFRELGFNVIQGGTHLDGLTTNALVILADGVYLELICFTHEPSYYLPGTPIRLLRDSHRWASKSPGWIDYAFLGNGSLTERISDVINQRASKDGSGVSYSPEAESGRQRPDGKELKWLISTSRRETDIGTLPFFCGDITPRKWRVESESNTEHPSTAQGILSILVLTDSDNFLSISRQLTSVVGDPPVPSTDSENIWQLDAPHKAQDGPKLVLRSPREEAEVNFVQKVKTGVYEVVFQVQDPGKKGTSSTPYGRIVWALKLK